MTKSTTKDKIEYVYAVLIMASLLTFIISVILLIWIGGFLYIKILATSSLFLYLSLAIIVSINQTSKKS